MKTSTTAKNPGRWFHACPFGRDGDWNHTFKWTDTSMIEEIEDLIEKVDNIEGALITLQKGFNACESEIDTIAMETRVCEAVVDKEIRECKMQLRSLNNLVGFALSTNFPDPVESAARKEIVRQAEELGEFEETAEQMVRASLPAPPPLPDRSQSDEGSSSQGRIPVSQHLGPVNINMVKPKPKKRQVGKRMPGRPPRKEPSPKPLGGVNSRKKKLLGNQPTPRRRLNMDHLVTPAVQVPPLADVSLRDAATLPCLMDFRYPSNRLT
ncbi:unnamed protein product [Arabidopsis arenosa]|uniref:Uncharacterized protein n=1 Tax=Arabidopsis arenosa TaxID=38785 RepID=A0A8S2A9S6_ARAAE|nr:unnamed protein product [Arabidopsis arenosa]